MNDNNEKIDLNKSINTDNSYTTIISQIESFTKKNVLELNEISSEALLVKIPVVLAEINIMFNMEANITLDRLTREIKIIKKNVFLTESRIIPFLEYDEPNTGILFIKGFIRNNIEYTSQSYGIQESKEVYGHIRYCRVETPFEFNSKITFIREPILNKNSTKNELKFPPYKGSNDYDASDKVIECEDMVFTEVFNENPFIELIRADIIEVDVQKNIILKKIANAEENVTNINEKSVVNLTIKVLQRQEVKISTV